MKRFTLDASVAAKWYANKEYSDAALDLAASNPEWVVPDLFFPEVANVLWKKVRRYEMAEADAREVLRLLLSIAIRVREAKFLIPYALELALEFECSVSVVYMMACISQWPLMKTAL